MSKTVSASNETAAVLDRVAEELRAGGARLAVRFSGDTERRQRAWPEAAPLSETDLRAELEKLGRDVNSLEQRMEQLFASLPEPRELELSGKDPSSSADDVPPSVYGELYGVVVYVLDEMVPGFERLLDRALAATPESLRAEWLRRHLPSSLADLIGEGEPGGSSAVAEVEEP